MSEIAELTKKLDGFILKYGGMAERHDEAIDGCKDDRDIMNKTLFDQKNGITVRVKGIETTLKGKQSTYSRTILTLNAFFMGGLFIMWIIRTVGGLMPPQ